jgi:predicted nucleotidyltransferase
MARDVLLGHVFGLDMGRATRDMDFAFALEGWKQFQQLQERLIAGGHFVAVRDITHRLLFCPGSHAQEYMVDLLPFGGVEQPTHTIAWPPDMQILMTVAGYRDVLETAPLVQVATGLIIRIVSLPGLAML